MNLPLTPYQSKYTAWMLTRHVAGDSVEALASSLVDAQIDLNPHQVDAALFAFKNPLSNGVILADEVGLGKTIEAGLAIAQRWAERKRRVLIIVPANLRKQWHQELQDKFGIEGLILESKSYNQLKKQGIKAPFEADDRVVICSYQFAKSKAPDLKRTQWDLVVLDEAHRLRNVYKKGNVIGVALKEALAHAPKVLLTATPLQNSLLELYGLVSLIDDRVFGDLDSFKQQFSSPDNKAFEDLRSRMASICQRTLRRQVQPYISYTQRLPIVQEFTPSSDEQQLRDLVAEYLRRPNLKALGNSQRQLISLVLWKLLASSSHAIGGALGSMAERLEKILAEGQESLGLTTEFESDYEALENAEDEWDVDEDDDKLSPKDLIAIRAEMEELRSFQALAVGIREDAKGQSLLAALEKGFAELERLGAQRKALIFTESKRTQSYLLSLLKDTPYGEGIVLFNGTNTDPAAQKVYKEWLERHKGSDKITGSKTADTRAALVEHFREKGTVMIATEAGAEGINLQFCSLIINYDLPWNPQRIEQRIGRCHRYGQKHDVVVVNFIDKTNPADQRVYELLSSKFKLFEGVFGASDEVLGALENGIDLEKRIASIYQTCRTPDEISESFASLQQEMASEIDTAMLQTRQKLLENMDEEVLSRLKVRDEDSKRARNQYERMLFAVTRAELADDVARFVDEGSFEVIGQPPGLEGHVEHGLYELPRRSGEAHLYRLGHPLAQWVLEQAKSRELPAVSMRFDYSAYASENGRVSTLEPYRGASGWLAVNLLTVEALKRKEEVLVVAAVDDAGSVLHEQDATRLLQLPASILAEVKAYEPKADLQKALDEQASHHLTNINQRNMSYFDAEVEKLEAWAEDLKQGLEQEIKELDKQIKDARKAASIAGNLEQKLAAQKETRTLESKRNKLRRDLYERQDAIESERNELIEDLEQHLQQKVDTSTLFLLRWSLH